MVNEGPVDLVLSSGFLAFARHLGFLTAIEESELDVSGVCGTSSGALVGAMWACGVVCEGVPHTILRPPGGASLAAHIDSV